MTEFTDDQLDIIRNVVRRCVSSLLQAQKHSSASGSPDANTHEVSMYCAEAVAAMCVLGDPDDDN